MSKDHSSRCLPLSSRLTENLLKTLELKKQPHQLKKQPNQLKKQPHQLKKQPHQLKKQP